MILSRPKQFYTSYYDVYIEKSRQSVTLECVLGRSVQTPALNSLCSCIRTPPCPFSSNKIVEKLLFKFLFDRLMSESSSPEANFNKSFIFEWRKRPEPPFPKIIHWFYHNSGLYQLNLFHAQIDFQCNSKTGRRLHIRSTYLTVVTQVDNIINFIKSFSL